MTLHYSTDGTWFDYDAGRYEQVAACGGDFHGRKRLTEDWTAVTCRTCRKLCGFDDAITAAVHAHGFASDEQLTELRGDPFRKRAA